MNIVDNNLNVKNPTPKALKIWIQYSLTISFSHLPSLTSP